MKGLGKFFVGGLLGAIFGFLISPKRAQKVRDALLSRSPGINLERPVRVAIPPAFQAAPAYRETDTPAPSAPATPPASCAAAESPTVEPELPPLEVTSSFTPGRTMEANVMAALVGPSLTLVPDVEPEPAPAAPPQVEWAGAAVGAEPEVRSAPEVLEEAVAATGWSDSEAGIVSADSVIEDLEPVRTGVAEPAPEAIAEVQPEVETEVQTLGVVESEVPPTPRVDPTDLRARIEDTRERIRRELELSFAARSHQEVASAPEAVAGPTAEGESEAAPEAVAPGADGVPRSVDGSFDQEAMRRRIEETRNRLKAKAFDAMMSGEASLLSRDSGVGQRASVTPPVPLDSEVAESIEKTLTEEEF